MANNEATNNVTQEATKATETVQTPLEAAVIEPEKTGFWSKVGTGLKVGLGFVAGGLAVGTAWVLTALLGGKDEGNGEETPAIGDGSDETPADE